MTKTIFDSLKAAVDGLLYLSESDESFEVFFWQIAADRLTPEIVKEHTQSDAFARTEEVPFERFFTELTTVHEGSAAEAADIKRFRELRDLMEHGLSDLRVFRIGQIRVAIYVVGKAENDHWCGVQTYATET